MKATLLFATTLSVLLASPGARGMSELEALRARCSQQEQQIQNLEKQLRGTASETNSSSKIADSPASSQSGVHVVKAGESLDRIARRSGCPVEQLAKANGLRGNSIIHPGQKLTLPGVTKSSTPATTGATQIAAQPKEAVSKFAGKTHTVRQGETYYSISRKYKLSTASLMEANPKIKATALRPGLVLQLSKDSAPKSPPQTPVSAPALAAKTTYPEAKSAPAPKAPAPQPANEPKRSTIPVIAEPPQGVRKAASAPAPQPKPSPAPIAENKPSLSHPEVPTKSEPALAQTKEEAQTSSQSSLSSSPTPEKKVRSVTVDNEMTYGEFAATHGTDTSRLNDLNGLDLTHATVLAKGSELYVPAQP